MAPITFRNNWPLIEWIVGVGWSIAVLYIAWHVVRQQGLGVMGQWTGWLLLAFVLATPFVLRQLLRSPLTWLRIDTDSVTVTEQRPFGRTVRSFARSSVGQPKLKQKPDEDGGLVHLGLLPLPDGSFAEFSRHPRKEKTADAVERLRAALATQSAV